MSKIVDPIVDYFLQIPLSEGNILQYLSHYGFKISKIQNADGSTKSLVFYSTSYPSKTVQFQDNKIGVENFLEPFRQTAFLILDEKEMTFLIKTPISEKGLAISKGDMDMNFPVRKVSFTGEPAENMNEDIQTNIVLSQHAKNFIFSHDKIQKIFTSIVEKKVLPDPIDLAENSPS